MIPRLFKREYDFDKYFKQVSKETGIPVSLLKGFAAGESAFNPKAKREEPHRNDASYGMLQLLYQTARIYGFNKKPEELLDPYLSLKYGALHIKHLSKKYTDLEDVIAAYNMGYPRPATKTTKFIMRIYGKPKKNWKYANQPYVDRIAAFIAFYQAIENKNINRAWEIRNLIYKKRYDIAKKYAENPFGLMAKLKKIPAPLIYASAFLPFLLLIKRE